MTSQKRKQPEGIYSFANCRTCGWFVDGPSTIARPLAAKHVNDYPGHLAQGGVEYSFSYQS